MAVSVIVLTPPDEEPRVKGDRFQISHILDPRFNAGSFNGSWISGKNLRFTPVSAFILKSLENLKEKGICCVSLSLCICVLTYFTSNSVKCMLRSGEKIIIHDS